MSWVTSYLFVIQRVVLLISILPMKSYMNTAMAEVAEGMETRRNNLFCHVPEISTLTLRP